MEKISELHLGVRIGSTIRDYFALTKFKVVAVMLFTVLVGYLLATNGSFNLAHMIFTMVGVGACAMSGAVLNHLVDRFRDTQMQRTKRRPVATGKVGVEAAFLFSMSLLCLGFSLLFGK